MKLIFFGKSTHNILLISCFNLIDVLEDNIRGNIYNYQPMQTGYADTCFTITDKIKNWVNFNPLALLDIEVSNFAKFHIDYYGN